MYVFAITSVVK